MADDELRPFFFSIDEIPAYTIAGMLEQSDVDEAEKQRLYDIFGRDLLTKVILQSPNLCVYHENANPGEKVKPHRHGTHQITSQGHLRIPAAFRHRCALAAADRVLLAADPDRSRLTIYSPAALDDALAQSAEAAGGEPA